MTLNLLVTALIIYLLLLIIYYFRPGRRRLRKLKRQFRNLYKNTNGFIVSKQARDKIKKSDFTLSYGEIEFNYFAKILHLVKPKPSDTFVDLGSGAGKAVITAALLYPFKKCIGIELLPELHHASLKVKAKLEKNIRDKVDFMQGNFFEFDIKQADCIFVNATGFFGEDLDSLKHYLHDMKPDARLIISSKLMPEDSFKLIHQGFYAMSWGMSRVCIYQPRR